MPLSAGVLAIIPVFPGGPPAYDAADLDDFRRGFFLFNLEPGFFSAEAVDPAGIGTDKKFFITSDHIERFVGNLGTPGDPGSRDDVRKIDRENELTLALAVQVLSGLYKDALYFLVHRRGPCLA